MKPVCQVPQVMLDSDNPLNGDLFSHGVLFSCSAGLFVNSMLQAVRQVCIPGRLLCSFKQSNYTVNLMIIEAEDKLICLRIE